MSDIINNNDKLKININIPEKKKTAYASDLTDTLGHKLGKNQIEKYNQPRLFYEDMNGQYIYTSDDGLTTITQDKDENDTKPIVSPTTDKVLTIILTKLNENFNGTNRVYLENITADEYRRKRIIAISLNDYMESVGLTDKKTAREYLKKASNELYSKSIKHTFKITRIDTDKKGKQKKKRDEITKEFRLLDAKVEFKSGNVIFYLSEIATPYLTEYSVNYNPKLIATDNRTYTIGKYLNRQYERTKNSNNNGKISVLKVLENCDIPGVKDVENRKYKEKIKTPLLDSLDYLKSINFISDYSFYNSHGKVYSKYNCIDLPINEFINLILDYQII